MAELWARACRGAADPMVRRWSAELVTPGAGDYENARRLLWSVQELEYAEDPSPRDDAQEACGTLQAWRGDCKKLSVLLAAACAAQGIRARLRWLDHRRSDVDHVSVICYANGRWWWAEPTVRGARLGEDPYRAAARLGALREGAL